MAEADIASPRLRVRSTTTIAGDVAGGLTGGITSVPGNIAVGVVALAPLGATLQGSGVAVALLAAAVGGLLFALACRTRGLAAGGSMSFALIVSGVLAALVQRGIVQPGVGGLPGALAVIAALTVLTGLCEALLATSGLGQLVAMLPYPVVSGIRNAVALLMILVQVRPMLGLVLDGGTLRWAHPAALAAAVATIALMARRPKVLRAIPSVLLALLVGALVHHGLALAMPGEAGLLGPLLSAPQSGLQQMRALFDGMAALSEMPMATLLAVLVPAAVTIALVSTLETLVGASVMQDVSGEHNSSRRDLFALAAANGFGGLCGITPVTGGTPGSMNMWGAGGRTKLAGIVRGGSLLLIALVAGPAVGLLPASVLGAMVVYNGVTVLDREALQLARTAVLRGTARRWEAIGNLLVMAVVIGVAVSISLVAAVLVGVLLSTVLFVVAMAGSAVRRRYSNPGSRSRTYRSEDETEVLARHGREIEIIELQGALFFGSVDLLARQVDAAWEGGARCVVLDFKRVSGIDLSAARRILQITERCWQRGDFIALSEVRPGTSVSMCFENLGLQGQLRTDRMFPALEEALAAAEVVVLAAYGGTAASRPMTPSEALGRLGIPGAGQGEFLTRSCEREYPTGGVIIRAGERADAFYILLKGRVEVSVLGEGGRARLATLTSGTLFGEMAILSGAPRSADVTALTPVSCLSMDTATFDWLKEARPQLVQQVMAAIAGQLARNLSMANTALQSTVD